MYGEYPRTMEEIVGNRLPKFTKEEVKMVKGSIDFVGINQYTSYYMYDNRQRKPRVPGYQQDWDAGFACMIILPYTKHHLQCIPGVLIANVGIRFPLQFIRMECLLVHK